MTLSGVLDRYCQAWSEPDPARREQLLLAVNATGATYTDPNVHADLAQGMDLPATALPFILRGVAVAGVDSVMAPLSLRERAWDRLARDLDPAKLDAITAEVPLSSAIGEAHRLMSGAVRGRIVVRTTD